MDSFETEMLDEIIEFWNIQGYLVTDNPIMNGFPRVISKREAIQRYWEQKLEC